MKLCVPTSWDNQLIENIKDIPHIYELYGCLPASVIGGGRAAFNLPEIDRQNAQQHIDLAHSRGIRFNYLINAPCFGGKEFDQDFRRRMFEYFDWIDSLGADTVTLSNPYILEIIKAQYPHWELKLGLFGKVNSIPAARYYEALGISRITLPISYSRLIDKLTTIRKAVDIDLELIVNQGCTWDCPLRHIHSMVNGHFSQEGCQNLYFLDFPRIKCSLAKLSPFELIRVPWIRPEDCHRYEELGIEYFKIAGREYSTAWITRCTTAYSEGSYDGNILDLLEDIYLILVNEFPYCLDNTKLEGFVDFFLRGKCSGECGTCDYCRTMAGKAVADSMPPGELERYKTMLEQALAQSLSRELPERSELRERHRRQLTEDPKPDGER